jgi:hypothetical protein
MNMNREHSDQDCRIHTRQSETAQKLSLGKSFEVRLGLPRSTMALATFSQTSRLN